MAIQTESMGSGLHLVNISGPLTEKQFLNVTQSLARLNEQGMTRVVVSLKDVPFMDSRGLAALITGYKTFGSNAQNFRLAELQFQPRLVLEVTGFDRIFEIFTTITDAAELTHNLTFNLPPLAVPAPVKLAA